VSEGRFDKGGERLGGIRLPDFSLRISENNGAIRFDFRNEMKVFCDDTFDEFGEGMPIVDDDRGDGDILNESAVEKFFGKEGRSTGIEPFRFFERKVWGRRCRRWR